MSIISTIRNLFSETKASVIQPLIYMMYSGNVRGVWTKRNLAQYADDGYRRNVIAFRSIGIVAKNCAGIPLKVVMGDSLKEVDEKHPLRMILKRPNPWMTQQEFIEHVIAYLMITGNTYVEGVGPDGQPPRELWPHRPDRMRVVPGPMGVVGYVYEINGDFKNWASDPIKGESPIMHMKFFNPLDDWYGMSPIEAAAYSVDQHNEAAAWNQSLLQNSARPSGALVYNHPMGGQLSEKQFERLKEDINKNFSGGRNAGKVPILESGLSWTQMSLSPGEMDWLEGKRESAREIALVFGVPPMMLGIPGDNTYSNYQEARQALHEDTIIPLLEQLIEHLNIWLCPSFGEDLKIVMDVSQIPALAPKREKIWGMMTSSNWMTTNEKRKACGLEEIEDPAAEEILVPSGLVPLSQVTQPPDMGELDENGNPIEPEGEGEEDEEGEEGKPKPGKPKPKPGKPPFPPKKYVWEMTDEELERKYSDDQPRDELGRFGEGAGSSGGSSGGSHDVDLPKNPKKLSIQQASEAMRQMGYELGNSSFDNASKTTVYKVTKNGKTVEMSTDDIKKLVYEGRRR